MLIREISDMPTCYVDESGQPCHESLLRSFHILEYVTHLLSANTPNVVIAELIMEMRSAPSTTQKLCIESEAIEEEEEEGVVGFKSGGEK